MKITHILQCCCEIACLNYEGIQYKLIEINDYEDEDLHPHLDSGIDFIKTALSNSENKILVHCMGGYSRSPSFVLAYLM